MESIYCQVGPAGAFEQKLTVLQTDPENLIPGYLFAAPVVKLGCSGRGVAGDFRGGLDIPPAFQVGGNSGPPEGMVTAIFRQPDVPCSAFDDLQGSPLGQSVLG